MSLYPVWADVDAIYQVLKQAGEIRGNSTNSPPTPPTAEHPPSGAAPSSARASSHPCSSSTSGKAHHQQFLSDLGTFARRKILAQFSHFSHGGKSFNITAKIMIYYMKKKYTLSVFLLSNYIILYRIKNTRAFS